MKTYYCVYYGFYGCEKTKLWSVYESELESNRGKIASQSYGYEVE